MQLLYSEIIAYNSCPNYVDQTGNREKRAGLEGGARVVTMEKD